MMGPARAQTHSAHQTRHDGGVAHTVIVEWLAWRSC
jgi:hypothetical protein